MNEGRPTPLATPTTLEGRGVGSPEGEGGRGYTGPATILRPNSDMAHNHTPLSRIDRGALACYGAL